MFARRVHALPSSYISTRASNVSVLFSTHASSFKRGANIVQVRCQSGSSELKIQRNLLSQLWIPTGGISVTANEDAHAKLVRGGFLRQAHSGIFHMLPLGSRVQNKIERLIDKHMSSIGASKLNLSSISSQELWTQSGRLSKINSELFLFKDRKDTGYLLSPTHEEEITSLVASTVHSYKDLPLRLYQISRKYRDELRPRHGLLRSREFTMKDLYTFDTNQVLALTTYEAVRDAYRKLFDELKIPYLVAEADSGDMGGSLSHEFHFPLSVGEDSIISCNNCDYVANEERGESLIAPIQEDIPGEPWSFVYSNESPKVTNSSSFTVWRGITRDRRTLVNVWYPVSKNSSIPHEINTHAVKAVEPGLDTSVEDPLAFWANATTLSPDKSTSGEHAGDLSVVNLIDYRLPQSIHTDIGDDKSELITCLKSNRSPLLKVQISSLSKNPASGNEMNLLRIHDGDQCVKCSGSLKVQKAVELGHTFFLGSRYSDALDATVIIPKDLLDQGSDHGQGSSPATHENITSSDPAGAGNNSPSEQIKVPMQMGCHGIGVSRLIGAVAEVLADDLGLNWPRVISPFEVVIIPTRGGEGAEEMVYDQLVSECGVEGLDLVIDDRQMKKRNTFAWKMCDADLIGYPIIIVAGKNLIDGETKVKVCQVQCRQLKVKEHVALENLSYFVKGLLARL